MTLSYTAIKVMGLVNNRNSNKIDRNKSDGISYYKIEIPIKQTAIKVMGLGNKNHIVIDRNKSDGISKYKFQYHRTQ